MSQLLETQPGVFLAATEDGIVKFVPGAAGASATTVYRPDGDLGRRINVLYKDRRGQVWCGTEGGLFRFSAAAFEPVSLDAKPGRPAADRRVNSLLEDSRGDLWIGTVSVLYRRNNAGTISEYRPSPLGDALWNAVLEDRAGRLWVGNGRGLWRILRTDAGGFRLVPVWIPKPRNIVFSILEAPGGSLWLGASCGLVRWEPDKDGMSGRARVYTEAHGLSHRDIYALSLDREGNLWLGSDGGGAMRVARSGFVTYANSDGLRVPGNVWPTLFRDRDGEVLVAFRHVIQIPHGTGFRAITPAIPHPDRNTAWGWHQSVLQDHTGEWWIPTSEGLVRFPKVSVEALPATRPKAIYTKRDGFRSNNIFRLFEDSRGGIWIAAIGLHGVNSLSRWDRKAESFRHFQGHDYTAVTVLAESVDGSVWIGYFDGTLGRYRHDSFRFYDTADGLAGGGIQALHVDRAQRLWIASTRGLTRADAPSAETPRFTRYGVPQGLSANAILCVAEDQQGRVYLATGHGIDRIQPDGKIAAGAVVHYTQADGLAKGDLRDVSCDRHGVLWCATKQGVSRFIPEPDANSEIPPVFIRRLRVRGVPNRLADVDAARLPLLTFAPDQNQLQIDYSGLAFKAGEVLSYQYKLVPADRDWSPPTLERTVNYSNIAPGRYRFSVRLITAGGLASEQPASLDLIFLAPVWQRWWFRLLLLSFALFLLYRGHRYRTMRLVELERVRTRIATDLHDDIGSGLSQIAVLTEVAMLRLNGEGAAAGTTLSNISAVSRELGEAMSDIVWSVNPQRDRFSDLVQRMRRFTSDMLAGRDIAFRFRASEQQIRLPVELRRELYLLFKEALNNLLRHSGCTRADIAICVENGCVRLEVEDNGSGFRCEANEDGHGLRSMRERAARMKGSIDFTPGAEGGSRVSVRAPLGSSRFSIQMPT